jgi:oligopeptide transport system substrate-binding protein
MLRDKKFDIAIVAIICDYNDSLALLSLFAEADSGVNFGGYNNPEYTRCITKATHALTESERQGYLRSALSQLLEDHMVIPVYFPRVARLVQERLRGYVANFLDIHPSQYLSCVAMTPDRTLS